ncbi:SAV_2336 N-terminal domain-related protein [Streptomyces sp. NPDC028635]|uniref:SAV_2336 N-terminal domain-related protein n=1 Tax=Streptomyces sp. NPDC028635 TaxID=3154800 RepID=UPI0033FAC8E2
MSSDPSPAPPALPAALGRLADVLAEAAGGPRPTALELAEVLWLARQMDHRDEEQPVPREPRTPPVPRRPEPDDRPRPAPAPPREPAPAPPRAPLHLPAPRPAPGATTAPHASLLAPAPPMLPHPLALQRALRPLGRRVDAPCGRELDERATAERIARLGADPQWWLPVLRPARERWLRLHLVHDAGPTMPVWRPLVRELHTTLARSGLFRTVTGYRADPDGTVHGPAAPADGRTVLLLVSDCMGPQWREGPAGSRWHATLRRWARRMPVAVLQPLPEHLWRDTALPAVPGRLSAPHPAAPAAALAFTPYEPPDPYEADAPIVLPVLEPGPRWLANWAALLAMPGRTEVPAAGAALRGPLPADAGDRTDVSRLPAEDLVLRFRATASPEAFRLAGHLAVGRPHLPVMRLVQAAVEPDPQPRHLAEVILSGMLTTVLGPPGSYAFRPGVREVLLRSLPRSARESTTELLERIGGLIDTAAGRARGEFRAATPAESGRPQGVDGEAFAHVRQDSVRRLTQSRDAQELFAGRYRLLRRLGVAGASWLAEDTEDGDVKVVVRRHSPLMWADGGFEDMARRLAAVRHPRIAAVRDHGTAGGFTYLVREYVEGQPLTDRLAGSPQALGAAAAVALLPPLVDALDALHAHGRPHGRFRPSQVLLTASGPVLICLDGPPADTGSRAEDLRTLGHLLPSLCPVEELPPQPARELATARSELTSDLPGHQESGADRLRRLTWPSDRLRYWLLGPPKVTRGDRVLQIPPGSPRTLLGVLLLRGGTATLEELASELSPQPMGHDFVTRRLRDLRAALTPHADIVVVDGTVSLRPAPSTDDVDTLLAARLAGRARSADDPARRGELAREALKLWRGTPLDGVPGPAARAARAELDFLRRDLESLAAAASPWPTVSIRTASLRRSPEDRISLEAAVHEVFSRSLSPHQYEVLVREDGYLVHTDPAAPLLPLLVAVVRMFPGLLPAQARLCVTFPRAVPAERLSEGRHVVVPPALYEEFAASSAAARPPRFRPLWGASPQDPPLAWYCSLSPSADEEERELVRGPLVARDPRALAIPAPGRTAVVHLDADGPLTLLDPARPHHTAEDRVTTYYEVDLTPRQARHEMTLPSSGKGDFTAVAELSWRVEDPVAFVHARPADVAALLAAHVREQAARITGRHPVRRAAGAERAVDNELVRWPVPGLAVTCRVRLAPRGTLPPEPRAPGAADVPLSEVLAHAGTVLMGFEGPVARLFSAAAARAAALDLLALVGEHRDPEDALTGRPLAVQAVREASVHPLDVLRTFARDRLGPLLRARLDELELRAVPDAPTTHHCAALIRALHGSGRRVRVITDVSEEAARRYLEPYRLPLDGVHGRGDDLTRLMPDPDCLLRALDGAPASAAVLIGSSPAELAAARRLGLPFVGLARTAPLQRQLREAGCEISVRSLDPLLEAARALPPG